MGDLTGKVALVTGASRGVGARVAALLAERGADVAVNYRSKGGRAEEVAAQVRAAGARALLAQADLTRPEELGAMLAAVGRELGRVDLLVLNASGGLERGRPEGYAMALNRDAQLAALEGALPLMPRGGRAIFVTSHWAHFYGERPVYEGYEAVAASKRAGEDAIRQAMPAMAARGVRLTVVSGDVIEGTITPRLLERGQPGLLAARRAQVGALPTLEEFAQAIVQAAADDALADGEVVFVGSTE